MLEIAEEDGYKDLKKTNRLQSFIVTFYIGFQIISCHGMYIMKITYTYLEFIRILRFRALKIRKV